MDILLSLVLVKDTSSTSWREGFAAWLLGAAAMLALVTASPHLSGNDSYYHVKMSLMLRRIGLPEVFPWLYWTFFRDGFVSHHYGFHVLLLPFVWLGEVLAGDPLPGAKAAGVFASGLTALAFWHVLRTVRIPHPLLWVTLLGIAPWHFWLRLSYVRAPMVALPLLLLAVALCARNRALALGVLAILFVNIYFGAVVFLLVPAAFLAGHVLAGTATRREWITGAAAVVGVLAGFVISPYFPENIQFMKVQLLDIGARAPDAVGNEWRPFNTWFLLRMSAPLALLWVGALVIRLRKGQPADGVSLALLLLNLAFLALTLKARRFVEYAPAFTLLQAADMARVSAGDLAKLAGQTRLNRNLVFTVACLALLLALPGIARARQEMSPSRPIPPLAAALDFLKHHSAPGTLVLTDDWDVFPMCFYYNDHNTYAVGLDPLFTAVPHPELWNRYRIITQGRAPRRLDPAFTVLEMKQARLEDIGVFFGASYALVMDDHPRLFRQMRQRTDLFLLIYPEGGTSNQPPAAVFEVLHARQLPAPR